MKTVILTSGPRAAGKSTIAKKIVSKYRDVSYVSADAIRTIVSKDRTLITEEQQEIRANDILKSQVTLALTEKRDVTLILDSWNTLPHHRMAMIRWLLTEHVDRVVCWHFVTPLEQCIRWAALKRDFPIDLSCSHRIDGFAQHYHTHHLCCSNLEAEGFAAVHFVDGRTEDPLLLL